LHQHDWLVCLLWLDWLLIWQFVKLGILLIRKFIIIWLLLIGKFQLWILLIWKYLVWIIFKRLKQWCHLFRLLLLIIIGISIPSSINGILVSCSILEFQFFHLYIGLIGF
jgi:hypothetical protein